VFREYKLTILLVVFLIAILVLIIATLVSLIHKRKQAEEALLVSQQLMAQSNKMEAIGQLASGVAHDFNNMLSGITGAADLLDRTATGRDRKLVTIILTSAQRAAHLTSKLLAFGRKGVIATAPVDLHETLENAVDILKLSLNKKTTVVSALTAEHSICIVDESQITNALLNLGINADHAMGIGGTLTYETRNVSLGSEYCTVCPFDIEPGEYLSIGVRDTGCGIAPEDLTRVFEPFYTTKEQGKGTGLGLPSVYGSIRDHQGAVTVSSEIDSGTLFQIYLPLCNEEVPKTSSDFVARLGEGELILVVDDEEVIRATAQAILKQHNYKAVTAKNGREAVEIFKKHHAEIDLVLMDLIMPEMSGREAQERMMEIDKNVRVVLSSGFTRDPDIDLASNTRLVAFLRKPYRRAELCRAVSEVLQKELEVLL
jgi:signal transduction histidine kinase/CheY-like chemotaxis protein